MNDLIEAYIQHELMNDTKRYLDRGRRFKDRTDDELSNNWAAAFHLFAKTGIAGAMEDLSAELRLRGMELPYERVSDEVAQIREEVKRGGVFAAEDEDELDQRIKRFLSERAKPVN